MKQVFSSLEAAEAAVSSQHKKIIVDQGKEVNSAVYEFLTDLAESYDDTVVLIGAITAVKQACIDRGLNFDEFMKFVGAPAFGDEDFTKVLKAD